MSKSTFNMSNKIGQMGEYVSLKYIRQKDAGAHKAGGGNYPDGDIRLSSGDLVEVKTDLEMASSRNHYIELSHKGKPSGLSTTKSKWWFVVTATKIVVCKTEKLREAVKTLRKTSKTNDDEKLMGYCLMPKSVLNDIKENVVSHGCHISLTRFA